jgi:hypothetical protein
VVGVKSRGETTSPARDGSLAARRNPDAEPAVQDDEPDKGDTVMADLTGIREHMEVIGADGVHIGTVDHVDGDRIKLTKKDSGSHSDHHHYISGGLVAEVEGDRVRLSANGDAAVLLEEEEGGEGLADRNP